MLNGAQEFEIHFQPICRLSGREVVGYEALARFPGDLPPSDWFAAADEYGLVGELEALTISCALTALPLVAPLYIAVNVSVATMLVPGFASMLHGLPAVVELTEGELLSQYEPLIGVLDGLRIEVGSRLKIAIDDLGAGHSGLIRVVRLHPDILKIDRELIAGVDHDTTRGALIVGLVIFAAATGKILVAEGVETEEELEALRLLGVECGQGWLLGRPCRMEGIDPCRGPL